MPMSGVRCPCCQSVGRETWVIPGKACGACAISCDGIFATNDQRVNSNGPDSRIHAGGLTFLNADSRLVNDTSLESASFEESWSVASAGSGHHEFKHGTLNTLERFGSDLFKIQYV